MTNTRLIFNNLWRKGTILGESSEHPQFPSTDTQGDTPSQFWRTLSSNNSCENAYISIDLLTAQAVDFIAILNHDISANATITWRGADDANFANNAANISITHNPTNIFHFFGANNSTTRRYVQLQIQDANNPSNYIQVGPVVMGTYWEPARAIKSQYGKARADDSIIDESHALVEYGQPRPRRKTWSLPFSGLSETDADTIVTFFDEAGLTYGFVLCLDYNNPNSYSYFVKNVELIEPTQDHYNSWSWGLNIREKL